MISLGYKYECSNDNCDLNGSTEWAGKTIKLQLDHIDGDRFNNELSNLRFLCPNCHSQTDTFARNNNKTYTYCICGRRAVNIADESKCIHTVNQDEIKLLKSRKMKKCKDCNESILPMSERCRKCEQKNRNITQSNISDVFKTLNIEEVLQNVKEKGYLKYSKELGVSDNGIRKYLERNGIDAPKKIRNNYSEKDDFCKCGNNKNRSSKQCLQCSAQSKTKYNYPSDDELKQMIADKGIMQTYKCFGIPRNSFYSYIRSRSIIIGKF